MQRIQLADGAVLHVRPLTQDDAGGLRRAFDRLSPESRYRRFLGPMPELRPRQLEYLVDVDHVRHEALVAVDQSTGDGVAIARYVRLDGDPVEADFALTVLDEWQGRGLGRALLHLLAQRARAAGVRRFSADILASNEAMLRLVETLGAARLRAGGDGVVHAVVEL